MMYGNNPLSVGITTLNQFSLGKCTGSPERRIFFTGIVCNLRAGETEYVRSIEQVNEVKMRLRADEVLTCVFDDDIYYIRLERKPRGRKA